MNDEEKTNEQLIKELEELRRRVKRFESRDAERKRIQKELEQHRRSSLPGGCGGVISRLFRPECP